MQDTITTMFCLSADLLQALGYRDDSQTRFSTAEVMTVPLVAAAFFGGNGALTRRFLVTHGYFRHDLSASRFNRRLHAIPQHVWHTLFRLLGRLLSQRNPTSDYVVDSLPVPACDNIRIGRCTLFDTSTPAQKEAYRGYCASKHRYYFGLKVHLVITGQGAPVEFVLTPAAVSDINGFKLLELDLPAAAVLHGDKAYTDYKDEDLLQAAVGLTLQAQRKRNSKRPLPLCKEFLAKPIRQRIETSFGEITRRFPKQIQAVTPQGFVLKLICFLLAFSIQCL